MAYFLYVEPLQSSVSCLTCHPPYLKRSLLTKDHSSYTFKLHMVYNVKFAQRYLQQKSLAENDFVEVSPAIVNLQHWHRTTIPILKSSFPLLTTTLLFHILISSEPFVCFPAGNKQKTPSLLDELIPYPMHINKKSQIWQTVNSNQTPDRDFCKDRSKSLCYLYV